MHDIRSKTYLIDGIIQAVSELQLIYAMRGFFPHRCDNVWAEHVCFTVKMSRGKVRITNVSSDDICILNFDPKLCQEFIDHLEAHKGPDRFTESWFSRVFYEFKRKHLV